MFNRVNNRPIIKKTLLKKILNVDSFSCVFVDLTYSEVLTLSLRTIHLGANFVLLRVRTLLVAKLREH